MTPKEKTKELYDKYEKMFPLNFTNSGENFFKSSIVKCALIAVDEILNTYKQSLNIYPEYWQEVKQEIEKL